MAEKDRAESRYGKKKSKSHKDKDPADWNAADAKAYMDSKEGQEHMAKMQRAQELMQQDQGEQAAPQSAQPGLAMQPAAPAA